MSRQLSRISPLDIGRIVAYGSLVIFGLTILTLLFPITRWKVDALDNTSVSTSTRLSVKAVETVSVRLASQVALDLEPKSTGSFGIAATELGVTTNDPEGFEVFLATADSEAALRGASDKISSISDAMVGSAFSGNTWGYSISKDMPTVSSTYNPVPATNASILKTSTATVDNETVYNLGFGVHITPSLPAGEYSASVLFSVVANPAIISGLQDLVYMQDMTSDICSNTYPTALDLSSMTEAEKIDAKLNPVTKQLYDIRDGKRYWVAKLADGNCWMTQNLALDLDTNADGNAVAVSEKGNKVELNSGNTDIATVWHDYAPSKTETEIPEKTEADYTSVRSWNFGDIVLTNPTGSSLCSQDLPDNLKELGYTADSPLNYNSVYYGYELTAQCKWYRNTDNLMANYISNSTSSVNADNTSYDAHYLIGNYYQWNTAVASSGNGLFGLNDADSDPNELINASGSICPNNWKLPTAGRNTSSTAGWPFAMEDSFYNLLRAYGYPETGSHETGDNPVSGWITQTVSGAMTAIVGDSIARPDFKPFYFVRSGFISHNNGSLRSAGVDGRYWASAIFPDNTYYAYNLRFNTKNVFPADDHSRINGNSVRCLAR